MKRHYRVIFSSKIDKIGDNVIKSGGTSASTCSNNVASVSIPTTLSTISENAFYECENLKSICVGKQVFNRLDGAYEIPIRLNGRTIIEKIKEPEDDCTIFPFVLKKPLCPEEL